MKKSQQLLLTFLLLSSFSLLGNGLYIKAKANVANWLIAKSWESRAINQSPTRPWPWADTWVVARLQIKRLGISQYIMQDASGESLAFGPGAMLPVNGSGYQVVAGHRDTHFAFLDKLAIGDEVSIETYSGQMIRYKITETDIVDSRKGAFYVDETQAGLSLITCWPMDSIVPDGPLRYVVSGTKT